MSTKRASPTAALLRQSRLFSLPQPLPRQTGGSITNSSLAGTQSKSSNTATPPYPTQQAIATPPSSQARGDWGLKRPLPLRSTTRSSTPAFRVNAVDTREHITDFDSSGDMVLTLQKYQELGLPLSSLRKSNQQKENAKSIFEEDVDHTDPDFARTSRTGQGPKRWKYQGPWLPGMSQLDFAEYVRNALQGRKEEFLAFARERKAQRVQSERVRTKTEQGKRDEISTSPRNPQNLTDEAFEEQLRLLRNGFEMESELAQLLAEFLDLPSESSISHNKFTTKGTKAPHATHPSAGLSYLRSDAVLPNHPLLGPLADPPSAQARVLADQKNVSGIFRKERIGVAGAVTADVASAIVDDRGNKLVTRDNNRYDRLLEKDSPTSAAFAATDGTKPESEQQQSRRDVGGTTIGITVPGGTRKWVDVTRAYVDERGRLKLDAKNSTGRNVAAHQYAGTGFGGKTPAQGAEEGMPGVVSDGFQEETSYRPRDPVKGFGKDDTSQELERYGLRNPARGPAPNQQNTIRRQFLNRTTNSTGRDPSNPNSFSQTNGIQDDNVSAGSRPNQMRTGMGRLDTAGTDRVSEASGREKSSEGRRDFGQTMNELNNLSRQRRHPRQGGNDRYGSGY
ncbi:MAG: hypothetical protein M1831_005158 [Alyxoria varia]|nr:MAG: hypothetical protein M1831_005158 [Alyxoria varia]